MSAGVSASLGMNGPVLTADGAIVLALTLLATGLFVWNRLRADVVALGIMLALILTGVVAPTAGIRGFAHEATVTVALMLVLAAGLLRTGAIGALARRMSRLAGRNETRILLVMVAVVLPLSAFINNTAAVAVLMPVMLGLGRSAHIAPSRLLMPLSFASQLGGTLTLIGTSTNLLIAGIALDLGVERLRLFDITPAAAIAALAGAAYLLTLGRLLLPDRAAPADLLQGYELHDYLAALRVPAASGLAGRTLAETRLGSAYRLQVILVERDGSRFSPTGATVLRAGDLLLVEGKIAELASVLHGSVDLEFAESELHHALADETDRNAAHFAEVLVPRRSAGVGANLQRLALRARFGVNAVALRRHGAALHGPIATVPLRAGDMLLVHGTSDDLRRLHEESGLVLLGAVDLPRLRPGRMRLSIAIVGGVVLLPALGITTILVSALLGVVAMLLTRCIEPDEAYADIDWMVIVLLGAILPLGEAMHTSGAAAWLAAHVVGVSAPLGPYGLLAVLLVVTTAFTAVISNAAAGVVFAPIAIALATSLDYSPLPLLVAVMIGASNSFLSPVGYQTNTMIYAPGGYTFLDYLRVGAPLTLIVTAAATFAIPLFFPFR